MMDVDPNLPEPEKCLLDFNTSNYDQASMLSAGFSTRKSAVEEVSALAVRYMLNEDIFRFGWGQQGISTNVSVPDKPWKIKHNTIAYRKI